ncbi:hypothetical protein GYMLUDRAFT_42557 [Collybiopsis luxurians FD-317 M1]|uniref:assimilatory sulfite reductase (NADPH) n=1 Tax=Collybiopsis luxurians FD-317 M1 TaxID=944289 RepID=A0A0D0C038_9AGAR|nr:hypothetical protein GYMLUDRAFT_42557 [Collybiopsis luxurians FD-317 M1]
MTNPSLVSLTASDSADSLPKLLLPHVGEIGQLPLVIHLEVSDLSSIYLLHGTFPFFLLSATTHEAHDNAIIASYLARTLRLTVLHVHFRSGDDSITDVSGLHIPEKFFDHASENSVQNQSDTVDDNTERLWKAYTNALTCLSSGPLHPFAVFQSSEQDFEVHTVIFIIGRSCTPDISYAGVRVISLKILTPLPSSQIFDAVPPSASRVFVLEQLHHWHTKWTPFYLEVVKALKPRSSMPTIRNGILGSDKNSITNADLETLLGSSDSTVHRPQLGSFTPSNSITPPSIPKHELCYIQMLQHLFDGRFEFSNSPDLILYHGHLATNPEFALGRIRGLYEERAKLVNLVMDVLNESSVDNELHALLSKWYLSRHDAMLSSSTGKEIIQRLEQDSSHTLLERLMSLKHHFSIPSRWIVVSMAWSQDIGASGLHHILSSGLPVNLLLLHTTPYTLRHTINRRHHDVGLYAMNYGSTYVASTALYSSYNHAMRTFIEADRFQGPSIVLSYLPYQSEQTSAVDILKETKLAVDSGYWPLYRWDPSKSEGGGEPFSLDSDSIKNDLAQFLDRQNHLSQLVRSQPALSTEIVGSLGQNLKEARRAKARETYARLLQTIDAPPMRIFYASDGGGAEKLANRLASRGKLRGLETSVAALDSLSLDVLKELTGPVILITSTAGQGEPPLNGRKFFKWLNAVSTVPDNSTFLSNVHYAVFGLGDSRYWPRAEDFHFFNRPSRDLDSKLTLLGAQRIVDLKLGDAQDADGSETQYKIWEKQVWKAFGVDAAEATEPEQATITLEHVKAASNFLRGTIAEGISDSTTGALAPSDPPLTKYHGIWQQDDRDLREERQAQGLELAYYFMVRARMTGGLCTPEQWLKLDRLADEYGNGTMKITTRQTLQFHGILKKHLKQSIQAINKAMLDTFEVGGDVNSNIVCSSISTMSKIHAQVHQFSVDISERLMPRTTAYHEIWLDKKMVAGHAVKDFEPIYGEWYLPRKFKIAIAVPPKNDVDVFTNDLGYIAIIDESASKVIGYNVLVGGGMGTTWGDKRTYPRLGSIIGFCEPGQGVDVAEAVALVQRDFGDRVNRKTARVKYTVDRMGLENFKIEVEKRLGFALKEARPFRFHQNLDDYGWALGENGKHYFTMFIENGRIQDNPQKEIKTGLREIAQVHKGTLRLTTNQHLVISEIEPHDVPQIKSILSKFKLDSLNHSGLRLSSSACVAWPTCGLAMAESERYLPLLIDKVEKICEENGLRNDAIVMRMTGCPAGCTKPYVAEIGFLGKAPGAYGMLLGGGSYGQRLAKLYRENVTEREILDILRPMIKHYALDRLSGESFGDFVIRAGYVPTITSGREWL